MSNNVFTGKEIYEMYKDKYSSINEKYNTENIFFELKRIPKEEIYKLKWVNCASQIKKVYNFVINKITPEF